MTTLIFTAFDKPYAPLAEITVPRMRDYAFRHGYRFVAYMEPLADIPNAIYWSGVLGAAPNLENFDRVMYLDVDQLITNPDKSIEHLIGPSTSGFHASKDWGNDATEPWQFSMCGWVAHKDCIPIFKLAYDMEPLFRDKPFPEQNVMQELAYSGEKRFVIHPRTIFNAVPDRISPGNVPEPWDVNCFCCHLTMLPIEERIQIAKEFYASTNTRNERNETV